MSARLQAFDSDSEGDEVPAAAPAAASVQPASQARRLAAQDGPDAQLGPAPAQRDATSSDSNLPDINTSDDEARAPGSHVEVEHNELVIEASESNGSAEDDVVEPAAAAEAQRQPAENVSKDLSSDDEGTEVLEPSQLPVAQLAREVPENTAESDSNEELEQQQEYPTGRQLHAGDESDSEGDSSAAADSDAAGGDSGGGASEEQHEDDVAAPATGHSSVDPDGEVEAPAVSPDEQGADDQLAIEQDGPSIPAGDPATAACDVLRVPVARQKAS